MIDFDKLKLSLRTKYSISILLGLCIITVSSYMYGYHYDRSFIKFILYIIAVGIGMFCVLIPKGNMYELIDDLDEKSNRIDDMLDVRPITFTANSIFVENTDVSNTDIIFPDIFRDNLSNHEILYNLNVIGTKTVPIMVGKQNVLYFTAVNDDIIESFSRLFDNTKFWDLMKICEYSKLVDTTDMFEKVICMSRGDNYAIVPNTDDDNGNIKFLVANIGKIKDLHSETSNHRFTINVDYDYFEKYGNC